MGHQLLTSGCLDPQVTLSQLARVYLEGQGDLVDKLITPVTHIVTPIIPIVNLVTESP